MKRKIGSGYTKTRIWLKPFLCLLFCVFLSFNLTSCKNIKRGGIDSDGSVTSAPAGDWRPSGDETYEILPRQNIIPVTVTKTDATEYKERYEAEDCGLGPPPIDNADLLNGGKPANLVTNHIFISSKRKGYSGDGYASGFETGDTLRIGADLPFSQHYNITVRFAADKPNLKNTVVINGSVAGEFVTSETLGLGSFITVKFFGVFFEEGETEVCVFAHNGGIDLDYVELENSENETSNADLDELSNKNASEKTKRLYNYLKKNYGEKIITGQYVSSPYNTELRVIYDELKLFPAIRFGDFANGEELEIQAALQWGKTGGIVGEMWHWSMGGDIYASSSAFNLGNAVTNAEIWNRPLEELELLYEKKEITNECLELIKDIDKLSAGLKILRDSDVPVLWRPLHEAGGGWFWWGAAGAGAYEWLWGLLYERMTNYHELNNLIWVWNAQDTEWLVDGKLYDIAAVDVYLRGETNFSSRSTQFRWLKNLTDSKKLVAVSELGDLPNANDMVRDGAVWSFFGLWYGQFITDASGDFHEAYNSYTEWYNLYNSELAITLYDYING